jgi:hypothetical protein
MNYPGNIQLLCANCHEDKTYDEFQSEPWRALQRKKMLSPETREKIRQANLGKTMSPETREKLRQTQLGRTPSLETRRKISESKRYEKEVG